VRPNSGTRASGILILVCRSLATAAVWAWALVAPVALVSLGVSAAEAQSRQRIISDDARASARGDNVLVLAAPDAVDGSACDSLGRISGVISAGAYRHADDVHLVQEPNDPVPVFEITAGLVEALAGPLPPSLRVLMGAGLAGEVGALQEVAVVGAATMWPVDAVAGGTERIPELTRSLQMVVPSTGQFDTCIVDFERIKPRDADSIVLALAISPGRNISVGTLSGVPIERVIDPAERLEEESPTRPLAVAGFVCFLTGLVSFRLRRREHTVLAFCGFGRSSRLLLLIVEALPLLIAAVAVTVVGGRLLEPDLSSRLSTLIALRAGTVAAASALLGLSIATLTQRTSQALVVLRDD